ncbi:MAG: YidC/Oxa1 family membrane protein insertase [Candidatus Komeilibacteria bacterium]|jgi:YidC/Oxa1 family membrane protein insertase|nr:YidC/Oxa1 family membrane protein insertase [Candidatus Komeilibacteria bacterium]MBT4447215.1 YidC/Oxa1 family membrane protein insertase [Candidatus Komeilibacteria bacterium]
MEIFSTIFYQPIFNLLVYIYNVIPGHDIGVAIIVITAIIKLILYIPSKQSIKSQKELATLQPEIEALKEEYKDDKDKMGPELMALYKKKGVNPLSSCMPMLIQLPFLFAIYRVFFNGLTNENAMDSLYSFVVNPGMLDPIAFGFINFAEKSIPLAILAGLGQFWQSKMLMAKKKPGAGGGMANMSAQMVYLMPIFTVFIGSRFPAGLTFYWFLSTVFSVAQQYIVLGFGKNKKDQPEVIDAPKKD